MSNSLSINEVQFKKLSKKIHKNIKNSPENLSLMNIQEMIASSAGFNNLHSLTTFFNQAEQKIENNIQQHIPSNKDSKKFLNVVGLDGLYDFYKYNNYKETIYISDNDTVFIETVIKLFKNVIRDYPCDNSETYTLKDLYEKTKNILTYSSYYHSTYKYVLDFFSDNEKNMFVYYFKSMMKIEEANITLLNSTWFSSNTIFLDIYHNTHNGCMDKFYSFKNDLTKIPFVKNSWLYTNDFFDFIERNYHGEKNVSVSILDLINYINNTISPEMKSKYMDLYSIIRFNFDKVRNLSEKIEEFSNQE